jgi:hypothetical protein
MKQWIDRDLLKAEKLNGLDHWMVIHNSKSGFPKESEMFTI